MSSKADVLGESAISERLAGTPQRWLAELGSYNLTGIPRFAMIRFVSSIVY